MKKLLIILSLIASTRVHGVEPSNELEVVKKFNQSSKLISNLVEYLDPKAAIAFLRQSNKAIKNKSQKMTFQIFFPLYAAKFFTSDKDNVRVANITNFITNSESDNASEISLGPLLLGPLLSTMGVKKILKVKDGCYGDYADYKGIEIEAKTMDLDVSDPSPVLKKIRTKRMFLEPNNDINLTVDKHTCDIGQLHLISSNHAVDLNSDNGIPHVCGTAANCTLDNKTCTISCSPTSQTREYPWDRSNEKTFDCGQWTVDLATPQYPRILIRTTDSVNEASFAPLKEFDWKTELQKENVPPEDLALFIDTPPQKDMAIPRDLLDSMCVSTVVTKTPFSCDCPDRDVIIDTNEDTLNISGLKAKGLRIQNHSGSQVHFGSNVECQTMHLATHHSYPPDFPIGPYLDDFDKDHSVTVTGVLPAKKTDVYGDEDCANVIMAPEVRFKDTLYEVTGNLINKVG